MTTQQEVRVRFAPSPTGYLHVGGVRTALFNWLFAKNKNGKFILRIEDTDRLRSTREALDDILNSLTWLGVSSDEELVFQSKRLSIYKEYAKKLLDSGKAYRSSQVKSIQEFSETEQEQAPAEVPAGEATVFKSTHEKITVQDIVHGEIQFDTSLIDDFVIIKSDGTPTYNFACVIDDSLMHITHVIRGDDHISNTPKQIMLYRALGLPVPQFVHVPIILGSDGTRLSKRHGATSLAEYRRQGYLAGALINFLALLGWSPGDDREVLTLSKLIDAFSLDRITGKSAIFNVEKLKWMNAIYISKLESEEMVSLCKPFLEEKGFLKPTDSGRLLKIIPLFKKRIKLLSEITAVSEYFFGEKIEFDKDIIDKFLSTPGAKSLLKKVKERLQQITSFEMPQIEQALRALITELKIPPKDLMQTVRAAITGRTVTPGIFETIAGMGKDLVLKHLDQAIGLIE